MNEVSCAAREAAAKLCGLTTAAVSPDSVAALLEQLVSVFASSSARPAAAAAAATAHGGGAKESNGTATMAAKAAARYEERDGALAAAGFVLAQATTGASCFFSHSNRSETVPLQQPALC